MAFLIKITGAEGEVLRKVDGSSGQTIKLRPGEERVVFPYVVPDDADIKTVGNEVRVLIDGREAVAFQNFALYLEDGTPAFTFAGNADAPAPSESEQSQDAVREVPVKTTSSGDEAGAMDYQEAAWRAGMILSNEELINDDDSDLNDPTRTKSAIGSDRDDGITEVYNDIIGSEKGETLHGTPGNDHICGREGDDTLFAGLGRDRLCGGRGTDSLHAQGDDDTVALIHGLYDEGVKVNLLTGVVANDGFGNVEQLYGRFANVIGSYRDDIIIGNNMANVLQGNEGDDILEGLGGGDTFGLWTTYHELDTSGHDVIKDFTPAEGDILTTDRCFFYNPILSVSGNDIILEFTDYSTVTRNSTVTLEGAFRGIGEGGTYYSLEALNTALKGLLGYNGGGDVIYYHDGSVII